MRPRHLCILHIVALPLQKKPREADHSVFVDDDLSVYPDQWAFLASIESMSPQEIEPAILRATGPMHPLDVTFIDEEDLATPWKRRAPDKTTLPGPLPEALTITLANLVYFEKAQLTQPLTNRLIRLAAFQNPEFYRAQAMRMSVWDKPRVIGCAENFPQHIGLPRGCLDAAQELLGRNAIRWDIHDERIDGTLVDVEFAGTLRPDQEEAVAAMLHHDVGVLCAPTAFGKTVTGAAIIARRRVNTLILVHRTELLRQWQERLNAFLGTGKGVVGTIGGGRRKPTGRIDIAVMQSLSRKGEVDPLVEDYGQVIVDDNFARSEIGRTPVCPQGARHGRRASMSPCRRSLVRRHPQARQSTLRPRTHRNTDPQGRSTADYLHAVWADPTCGGTTGQRAA